MTYSLKPINSRLPLLKISVIDQLLQKKRDQLKEMLMHIKIKGDKNRGEVHLAAFMKEQFAGQHNNVQIGRNTASR